MDENGRDGGWLYAFWTQIYQIAFFWIFWSVFPPSRRPPKTRPFKSEVEDHTIRLLQTTSFCWTFGRARFVYFKCAGMMWTWNQKIKGSKRGSRESWPGTNLSLLHTFAFKKSFYTWKRSRHQEVTCSFASCVVLQVIMSKSIILVSQHGIVFHEASWDRTRLCMDFIKLVQRLFKKTHYFSQLSGFNWSVIDQ